MTLAEAVETLKRYCDERYEKGRNCDNCQFQVIRETGEIQYEWCALSQSPTYWEQPTETNIYDQEEIHNNATVQILRNSITGEESIGWWENE